MSAAARYDDRYRWALAQGWPGWGGHARIAKLDAEMASMAAHPAFPAGGTAIELGCGAGNACRWLVGRGFRVTGVDISGVALDWARRETPDSHAVDYQLADLSRPDWRPPGQFDLVLDGTCLHCLIGVRRRRHFLNHARALLAPNGVLVIGTIINPGSGTRWWWRSGRRWRELVDFDTLCRQLNGAGLAVIDSERRDRARWQFVRLFARARSRN